METALLSLLIFTMRVVDVSLGTIRIVMLVRARRWLAGVLGFFESLTWVLAAGLVLSNLDSPFKVVAFALGFAGGTVLGSTIEQRLAIGKAILRIVTSVDAPEVSGLLRDAGYGVTEVNGEGLKGEVRVAFTVVRRKDANHVLQLVHNHNPNAYVTLEDVSTPELAVRRRRVRP